MVAMNDDAQRIGWIPRIRIVIKKVQNFWMMVRKG